MRQIAAALVVCCALGAVEASAGEEVPIDFDALEEAPSAQAVPSAETEALLPVQIPPVPETSARWSLAVLAVLLPLSAMLLPAVRKQKSNQNQSRGTKAFPSKES